MKRIMNFINDESGMETLVRIHRWLIAVAAAVIYSTGWLVN
jgi:hypothetical protein